MEISEKKSGNFGGNFGGILYAISLAAIYAPRKNLEFLQAASCKTRKNLEKTENWWKFSRNSVFRRKRSRECGGIEQTFAFLRDFSRKVAIKIFGNGFVAKTRKMPDGPKSDGPDSVNFFAKSVQKFRKVPKSTN